MTDPVELAVVTGGHSFDVPAFHGLFRRLEGISAYVQSMDDFASSPNSVRQGYDAILLYTMLQEGPADKGLPWYAGTPLTALSELGDVEQGIVLLHHALLAYPQWPLWDELVGIDDRDFDYYLDETVHSRIADPNHPITAGLGPWEMVDEAYLMQDASEGSEVLITYDHPRSMATIAWVRRHRNARVFCYQAGHGESAYARKSFQEALRRGILWSAGRI